MSQSKGSSVKYQWRAFSRQRPLEIASTFSHIESIFREMGCLRLCAWFHSGRKTVKCFQDDTISFQLIPLQEMVFYWRVLHQYLGKISWK